MAHDLPFSSSWSSRQPWFTCIWMNASERISSDSFSVDYSYSALTWKRRRGWLFSVLGIQSLDNGIRHEVATKICLSFINVRQIPTLDPLLKCIYLYVTEYMPGRILRLSVAIYSSEGVLELAPKFPPFFQGDFKQPNVKSFTVGISD